MSREWEEEVGMARGFRTLQAGGVRGATSTGRGGPLPLFPDIDSAVLHIDAHGGLRAGIHHGVAPTLTEIGRQHRRAAAITARAHVEVLRRVQPGMTELELAGIIDQTFAAAGASGRCFPSIVAAGPHSTVLHHEPGRRALQRGDVVVVDIGATYQGWCADIARTYPVSGRFTARQRQVYELVLDAQQAAAAYIVPGRTSMRELTAFVMNYFRQSPLRARDRTGRMRSMDRFFTHSAGHYLGREVHPPANYAAPIPLHQVFTIEPGLYIESEELGVRIEDDFVLTEGGAWNLWPALPSAPADIEAAMAGARA
jgi:Xaa-Pro aminopeptidase